MKKSYIDQSQLLDDEFLDALNVSSARECTGLMPSLPQSEAELESYKSLFSMEVNSLDTLKKEEKELHSRGEGSRKTPCFIKDVLSQ